MAGMLTKTRPLAKKLIGKVAALIGRYAQSIHTSFVLRYYLANRLCVFRRLSIIPFIVFTLVT